MTELLHARPTTGQRLLGPTPREPLPLLGLEDLISVVAESGLTGRGGAGFPTARKLRSVAGRQPVVIGNAMEGEPLSSKDAVLLATSPGLVLDGLGLLAHALGATRVVLATGPGVDAGPVVAAAHGSPVEVLPLRGRFVTGQESALANLVDGRPGVPSDPLVPVWMRGVGGRPTLVLNAETLAHLALLARHGATWFRQQGTPSDPGTFLVTVSGSTHALVASPGVSEHPRGRSLREVLEQAGTDLTRVQAVLVGGFHGTWVPVDEVDVAMSTEGLARVGATPGAGVVHALDGDECPLQVVARVSAFLAGEGARQCGPCVNGLPRLADALRRLADPRTAPGTVSEIEGLRRLVEGRGACAHPSGTVRTMGSALHCFADHVDQHLGGGCRARARRLDAV